MKKQIIYKDYFEMTDEELFERVKQFERQYYQATLSQRIITSAHKIYLSFAKEEIAECKKEIQRRCIQKN